MKSFREREWHMQKYSSIGLEAGGVNGEIVRSRQARSWSSSVWRTLFRSLNFVLYKNWQICGTWHHSPVCTSGRHNYYAIEPFPAELKSGLSICLHAILPTVHVPPVGATKGSQAGKWHHLNSQFKKNTGGTSLVAQWLRFHTPNAGGPGLVPGQGTRSYMHATTKEPTCLK